MDLLRWARDNVDAGTDYVSLSTPPNESPGVFQVTLSVKYESDPGRTVSAYTTGNSLDDRDLIGRLKEMIAGRIDADRAKERRLILVTFTEEERHLIWLMDEMRSEIVRDLNKARRATWLTIMAKKGHPEFAPACDEREPAYDHFGYEDRKERKREDIAGVTWMTFDPEDSRNKGGEA